VNRNDFRELSRARLREAEALLAAGHYSGAYYLAGYAVECALKACIARKTRAGDFPELEITRASYTHNLRDLVKTGGLEQERERLMTENRAFEPNWRLVKDWSEASRTL
jgi:HEPN domain-containing protein